MKPLTRKQEDHHQKVTNLTLLALPGWHDHDGIPRCLPSLSHDEKDELVNQLRQEVKDEEESHEATRLELQDATVANNKLKEQISLLEDYKEESEKAYDELAALQALYDELSQAIKSAKKDGTNG